MRRKRGNANSLFLFIQESQDAFSGHMVSMPNLEDSDRKLSFCLVWSLECQVTKQPRRTNNGYEIAETSMTRGSRPQQKSSEKWSFKMGSNILAIFGKKHYEKN